MSDESPPPAARESASAPALPDVFTLLDHLGDAVIVLDREYRIVAGNAAAERISTQPDADVAGAPLWDVWAAASGGTLEDDLRRAMTERLSLHVEHHVFDASGHAVWLDVRVLPMDSGLIVVGRDITAHKQHESTARLFHQLDRSLATLTDTGDSERAPPQTSEARLRRTLEATRTLIADRARREERARQLQELTAALSAALDPQAVGAAIIERAMPTLGANAGNVFLLDANNRELLSMSVLGYEPEIERWARRLPLDGPTLVAEVARTGEPILLSTWEERIARYPHHRSVHAKGGDRAVAGLPLKVEGRTIGALSLAFPIDRAFDTDDRLFMATVADLCAQALVRARLYETVRNNESHARLIAERAPAYIAHCDRQGRFLFVNHGYAERFGLTREELLGKTTAELIGEAAYATFREHVEAVLAGREVEFEVTIDYPAAGRRHMQVAYAPDRDERGQVRGFIAVSFDVTERQKAEFARQFLADASEILGTSLDPETTLANVTRIAAPGFADLCVTYLMEGENPRQIAVAHADLAMAQRVLQLQQLSPIDLHAEASSGLARVLRSGEPEFLPELSVAPDDAAPSRESRGGLLAAVQTVSSITVPLLANGRVTGAMQFMMTDAARRFTIEDLWLAEELARRCATALENSRLYRSLQESETRFRQLADTMPQIAWVIGADGATMEYMNKRWFEYTGAEPGLGTAAQANEPIHPDDRLAVLERWADAFRTGEPFASELRLRGRDGAYRWFLSRSVPVRDAAGKIVKWFGTSTDIDETKRVEANQRFLAELGQTLASSLDPEETLRRVTRLVVPALADYCFVDLMHLHGHGQADGQIQRVAWAHVDPAEQRLFDEHIARYLPLRLHPEHPISRTLETGEPRFVPNVTGAWLERIAFSPEHLEFMRERLIRSQMTVPLRARDRTLGAITFCFTDASGRRFTPENLAFARDLADRVALAIDNARLYINAREAEAKVRRLLDAGVVGVIVTNPDRILEANDYFLEMVGYTREELDGGRLRWTEMTPPEYAELDARGMAELEERGVCTPFEKEYIRRDGSRIPILIGAAALQRDPPLWICFILDLTERKRGEDEWRAFIDATAHDLRNPLTAVLGQTQLMQRRLRRDDQINRDDGETRLAAIAASAARASGLIDDLMDTARLQAGQPLELRQTPVDLIAVVSASVEEVRRFGPSHTVRVETDVSALVVFADGSRIERVVRNILDNAIKYSPAGGDVIVRAGRDEDEDGSWAVLTIEDRGLGIPEADLPYVFDRFRRGGNIERQIAGSGIGLTGAKQIVAQHGGTITVQSAEGEGSAFTLRLPMLSSSR